MSIKQRIKEILIEKAIQYEADIKSGKKKLIMPVKDYINKDGIRVRVYKKETDNIKYEHIPNFILDKRKTANIERRNRILQSEQEENKYVTKLY